MLQVINEHRVEDLVDHRAWNEITLPYFSSQDSFFTDIYVGIFGVDLLDFFIDCIVSNYCDYDTLVRGYDGWAIGAYFY